MSVFFSVNRAACSAAVIAAALVCAAGCNSSDSKTDMKKDPMASGKSAESKGMKVSDKMYGKTAMKKEVHEYTLTNATGASMKVLDYGGTITHLMVPDKNGKMGDVVLGFDSIDKYEEFSPYFGALIGRYANRIAKGQFTVDGKEYQAPTNNGENSLHGGLVGYDKRVWDVSTNQSADGPQLILNLTDKEGEQGYPGTVKVQAVYTLTNDNTLRIEYTATTDKATPINLTNHSYFNLKDCGKTSILDHVMQIMADKYTPVNDQLIPTGELADVKGTPYDFTQPKPLKQDIAKTPGEPNGFDHNFVLRGKTGEFKQAAEVYEPTTGRVMKVYTTEPGIQLYTGNFLDGSFSGKYGYTYNKNDAFCLETQHFPDSPNQKNFPSTILKPGDTFKSKTEYRFGVKK